jgi:hypothetical protein
MTAYLLHGNGFLIHYGSMHIQDSDIHGSHTAALLVRFTLSMVRFFNTLEVLLQQLEKKELLQYAGDDGSCPFRLGCIAGLY